MADRKTAGQAIFAFPQVGVRFRKFRRTLGHSLLEFRGVTLDLTVEVRVPDRDRQAVGYFLRDFDMVGGEGAGVLRTEIEHSDQIVLGHQG